MIGFPYGSLVTGIMFITAGCLTMVRHMLLEPVYTHYPKAPGWLRHSMFGFASVVIFIGLQYVWVFISDGPHTVPPQPEPSTQLLALAMVLYKGAMLANIVRQREPSVKLHAPPKKGVSAHGLRF